MTPFDSTQDAINHAAHGGQALLLLRRRPRRRRAGQPVSSGRLYDHDQVRLARTARRIGLGTAFVLGANTPRQHIIVPARVLPRCRRELETGLIPT
ncbi:MAG: hypothetical protein ACODAQ_12160 [Phycisphaeraceae bacterium]